MPTYQYTHLEGASPCSVGETFEKMEKITSDPQTICEVCKQPIKRMISSGAGVIFKGSGFFSTDYPKK